MVSYLTHGDIVEGRGGCDHSNESSSTVVLQYHLFFSVLQNEISDFS